jgi:endonuclease/exonuclease/phosphatase family metal-dependent hydrolase
MDMQSLRIVTINTWKCDGAYRARLRWLGEELKRLQPDVVALQESFRDVAGQHDTAAYLARVLHFRSNFTPARFKQRLCEGETLEGWSGMALLSRRPWRYVASVDLPSDPRDGERVAQIGHLDWQGGVTLANLHLTHLRDAEDLRREQLETLLSHQALQDVHATRILCGDFNMTLDGSLLGEREGASLRDTYDIAAGAPLVVVPPADQPRIDYILSLAEDDASQPVFSSPAVVLDRPDPETGVYPSDHRGVACTLLAMSNRRWRPLEEARLG